MNLNDQAKQDAAKEARLLQAMAKATPSEQRRILADLNELRAVAAARREASAGQFLTEEVQARFTPVSVFGSATSESDWMDEIEDGDDPEMVSQAMAVEAASWLQRVDPSVMADSTELNVQAQGIANRTASSYVNSRAARMSFLAELNRLTHGKIAMDDYGNANDTLDQTGPGPTNYNDGDRPDDQGMTASRKSASDRYKFQVGDLVHIGTGGNNVGEVIDIRHARDFDASTSDENLLEYKVKDHTGSGSGWHKAFDLKAAARRKRASEDAKCATCGKPATNFAYEDGYRASGFFCCDEHVKNYDNGDRTIEKVGRRKTAMVDWKPAYEDEATMTYSERAVVGNYELYIMTDNSMENFQWQVTEAQGNLGFGGNGVIDGGFTPRLDQAKNAAEAAVPGGVTSSKKTAASYKWEDASAVDSGDPSGQINFQKAKDWGWTLKASPSRLDSHYPDGWMWSVSKDWNPSEYYAGPATGMDDAKSKAEAEFERLIAQGETDNGMSLFSSRRTATEESHEDVDIEQSGEAGSTLPDVEVDDAPEALNDGEEFDPENPDIMNQRTEGRRKTSKKYTVEQDAMNGNRWQVRYYDESMGMWFDAGDGKDSKEEAQAYMDSLKSEGSRKTASSGISWIDSPNNDGGYYGTIDGTDWQFFVFDEFGETYKWIINNRSQGDQGFGKAPTADAARNEAEDAFNRLPQTSPWLFESSKQASDYEKGVEFGKSIGRDEFGALMDNDYPEEMYGNEEFGNGVNEGTDFTRDASKTPVGPFRLAEVGGDYEEDDDMDEEYDTMEEAQEEATEKEALLDPRLRLAGVRVAVKDSTGRILPKKGSRKTASKWDLEWSRSENGPWQDAGTFPEMMSMTEGIARSEGGLNAFVRNKDGLVTPHNMDAQGGLILPEVYDERARLEEWTRTIKPASRKQAVDQDSCPHPVARLVDPADLAEGTKCHECGKILPVNGVPLREGSRKVAEGDYDRGFSAGESDKASGDSDSPPEDESGKFIQGWNDGFYGETKESSRKTAALDIYAKDPSSPSGYSIADEKITLTDEQKRAIYQEIAMPTDSFDRFDEIFNDRGFTKDFVNEVLREEGLPSVSSSRKKAISIQEIIDQGRAQEAMGYSQIDDSTRSFTLAPGQENSIELFTDRALSEALDFWKNDGGATQPNMPGYDGSMVQMLTDELNRRGITASRKHAADAADTDGIPDPGDEPDPNPLDPLNEDPVIDSPVTAAYLASYNELGAPNPPSPQDVDDWGDYAYVDEGAREQSKLDAAQRYYDSWMSSTDPDKISEEQALDIYADLAGKRKSKRATRKTARSDDEWTALVDTEGEAAYVNDEVTAQLWIDHPDWDDNQIMEEADRITFRLI